MRSQQTVTGRFGQDPFRPEKTWTFRPKAWTIRPRMMNVSAKKMDVSAKYIFNSFTETNDTHYRKQSFRYVACRLLRWQQQAELQKTGIINFAEKSRQQYNHFGRNVHIIICLPISRQNKPSVRSQIYRSFDYRDNSL